MCNTNLCPAGIATQNPALADKLDVQKSAGQLNNFLRASTHLMQVGNLNLKVSGACGAHVGCTAHCCCLQVLARACGHDHLNKFTLNDITTWKYQMAQLSGVPFSGVGINYAYQNANN